MGLQPDTLDGLVRLGVGEALFENRTVVLAKVTAWIPEKQAINAKPLIQRKRIEDEEIVVDGYPILRQVPVSFPRWGGYVIRFPIQVDDVVILLISDREIERWLAGTEPTTLVEPRGYRVGALDDAIAFPGISPWAKPIDGLADGELVVGREDGGGEVRIHADGSISLGSKDGSKQGVARLNDQVKSDSTTDGPFWAWIQAVNAFILAAGGATTTPTGGPIAAQAAALIAYQLAPLPSSETAKVIQASSVVETE